MYICIVYIYICIYIYIYIYLFIYWVYTVFHGLMATIYLVFLKSVTDFVVWPINFCYLTILLLY